jgi:hypothetical protein
MLNRRKEGSYRISLACQGFNLNYELKSAPKHPMKESEENKRYGKNEYT